MCHQESPWQIPLRETDPFGDAEGATSVWEELVFGELQRNSCSGNQNIQKHIVITSLVKRTKQITLLRNDSFGYIAYLISSNATNLRENNMTFQ